MFRREFIKMVSLSLAALPAVLLFRRAQPASAKTKEVPPPAGMSPIAETDPVATAVGYKHKVKDVDYKKYPNRKKPDAKNQFCKNCALYTQVNESWGKCSMLTAGLVSAEGWCGSWSKKS